VTQSHPRNFAIRTARILDTPLCITNYRRLSQFCFSQGNNGHSGSVTIDFADMNVLFLRKKDEAFREITDTAVDLFVPDGVSLKLLLTKKGVPVEGYLTATRFLRHCCLRSPDKIRHFILGGTQGGNARLIDSLKAQNPGLNIVGSHVGDFSADEEEAVVREINRCAPDILWNCLPTPRQESFANRWKSALEARLRLLVGAGFDFERALAEIERAGKRQSSLHGRNWWGAIRSAVGSSRGVPAFFWMLRKHLHDLRREPAATPITWWASGPGFLWAVRRRVVVAATCLRHRARHRARVAAKRALDLTAGLIALIVTAPLFVLTAAIIYMVDGRPFFFAQRRVGKDGRIFRLWKFRTMRRDAELVEQTAQSHKIDKDEHFFKDPDDQRIVKLRRILLQHSRSTKYPRDPRIIRFGRMIRGLSLDELPQIFQVISGKLSLVGPRPFAVYEVADYGPRHVMRHRVKPGITGPWQISDRNKLTFEESIELDLNYIRQQSLALDLKILLKTIPAAFKNRGGE
jgi:lipopolysaccharide/colanic/teichoic acid biosynthesis glycosyltransferase/UDP-N-acetyl-D-mannosaminuronic acid transferase (WecB/TagA/CpsF family)